MARKLTPARPVTLESLAAQLDQVTARLDRITRHLTSEAEARSLIAEEFAAASLPAALRHPDFPKVLAAAQNAADEADRAMGRTRRPGSHLRLVARAES